MNAGLYYTNASKHLVAVDCIIFGFDEGRLRLLIIKREVAPMEGKWSLIGGFLQEGESTDEAAERILEHVTGLDNIYMNQLRCYGEVARDSGARVISVAYYALIRIKDHDHPLVQSYEAHWLELHQLPELIFDHARMIEDALAALRNNAKFYPIGFELLPQKFTLSQLRCLYEEIYQKTLDKRNFRKKILSLNVIERLEEKDRISSKKGAHLYRFDFEKYEMLKRKGLVFEI